MIVLAVDPGPTETAWAFLSEDGAIWNPPDDPEAACFNRLRPMFRKEPNEAFLSGALYLATLATRFRWVHDIHLVLEQVQHYGKDMHAGETTFETCVWTGRFIQRYLDIAGDEAPWSRMGRREVKHILAGSARAKDGDIRVIVRDRLGPKGTKKEPGPSYGVTADVWQALGLGLAWIDLQRLERKADGH